jgi:predicted DsbA family dithiol-disulfide isomerase
VTWKPFFLNSAMGAAPQGKRKFYHDKFGEDRFNQMEPHMTKVMAEEGINVTYDGLVAGTLDSHRLQEWALSQGKQNQLVEAIMHQYFEQGKSPADTDMLAAAAGEVGLNQAAAAAYLATDEGKIEVSQQAASVRRRHSFGWKPVWLEVWWRCACAAMISGS